MYKHFAFFVAFLTLTFAVPAQAERPSFSYLQLGFQSVDLDVGGGTDVDGDGFGLGGAFEIGDDWFGFASYGSTGFDFNVDLTEWGAGVGWHTGMSDNTDFFATVSFVGVEIDAPGFGSIDESGYGLGIGIRSNVSDLIELAGGISYADLGDGADGTTISGSIWFNITDAVALGIGAASDDDVTTLGANFRWYFDE